MNKLLMAGIATIFLGVLVQIVITKQKVASTFAAINSESDKPGRPVTVVSNATASPTTIEPTSTDSPMPPDSPIPTDSTTSTIPTDTTVEHYPYASTALKIKEHA